MILWERQPLGLRHHRASWEASPDLHAQSRNPLEITHVERGHLEPQGDRRSADEQIMGPPPGPRVRGALPTSGHAPEPPPARIPPLGTQPVRRLTEAGHELRRPEADYLRDGVYELRARHRHINYRILYFFYGQNVAILAHALTKEGAIAEGDIERTKRRKEAFERDPERHTYEEEASDG